MSKRLFMDFEDEAGDTCYVDVFAIAAIMPDAKDGRIGHSILLCDYFNEIVVVGEPKKILERVLKAATDNYHLERFGFIPGEPPKGGG